jgi:hypothetical protein
MSRLNTTLPMATRSHRCKITYSDCTTWWTAALRQTRSRGELWNIGDCQITLDKRCITHCVSRGGVDRNRPNAFVRLLGQQANDPPPPNNQATANAKSRSHEAPVKACPAINQTPLRVKLDGILPAFALARAGPGQRLVGKFHSKRFRAVNNESRPRS